MNAFAYIFLAWIPIFTFPTYAQPYVQTGLYVTAGFAALAAISAGLIGYLDTRDKRIAARIVEERALESPGLSSVEEKQQ